MRHRFKLGFLIWDSQFAEAAAIFSPRTRILIQFLMKRRISEGNPNGKGERINGSGPVNHHRQMKKNMMRLGGSGRGLSLEAFANAKTKNNNYNPALIKRQREFYKNAKYMQKYKKSLKQEGEQNDPPPAVRLLENENENENEKAGEMSQKSKRNRKKGARSLEELYKKKQEEEEKATIEREAIIQTKKEERERSEYRRKALREKMLKKTRSGQPVMRYRIEHILETLQGSTT